MRIAAVLTLASAPFITELLSAAPVFINLDFNAPAAGTLPDASGFGTGFTARLPGTGGAIPWHDPNMDLSTSPGKLLLTSSHAAFPNPFTVNLPILDAPSVFIPNLGPGDITIKAVFED